jgi:hypothetical protein
LAPKWPKSRAENAEGAVDAENAEDAEVVGAVDAEDAEEFRGKFRFSDPTIFRFGNRFGKFEYIFRFGDRFWQRTLIVFIPVWMSHFFN